MVDEPTLELGPTIPEPGDNRATLEQDWSTAMDDILDPGAGEIIQMAVPPRIRLVLDLDAGEIIQMTAPPKIKLVLDLDAGERTQIELRTL